MFKNKNEGKNNLCGDTIRRLRLSQPAKLSQRGLADKMQLIGIDVDKNAIQRIAYDELQEQQGKPLVRC